MTLKEFDSFTIRDFENGAVISEIRDALKEKFAFIKEIENLASEVGHYKALYYGLKETEAKRESQFISHIQKHLGPDQLVICKICGKNIAQIYTEPEEKK